MVRGREGEFLRVPQASRSDPSSAGSTRFMAPEEHALGARIDQRTTVFTLGRTAQQFLVTEGEYSEGVTGLVARACETAPELRFQSVADFCRAWSAVAGSLNPA